MRTFQTSCLFTQNTKTMTRAADCSELKRRGLNPEAGSKPHQQTAGRSGEHEEKLQAKKNLRGAENPLSNLWEAFVLLKIRSCRDTTHFMTWLFYLKWIPLWSWDPQSKVTFISCAERPQIIIGPHSLIWGSRQWWCGGGADRRRTALSPQHCH